MKENNETEKVMAEITEKLQASLSRYIGEEVEKSIENIKQATIRNVPTLYAIPPDFDYNFQYDEKEQTLTYNVPYQDTIQINIVITKDGCEFK